jgi:hypothetical protein
VSASLGESSAYRFSITLHSDEQSMHRRMTALARECGGEIKQVPSDERAEFEWAVARNTVTFVFQARTDRDHFAQRCAAVLPGYAVQEVSRSDASS